jgi:hypothetical protein
VQLYPKWRALPGFWATVDCNLAQGAGIIIDVTLVPEAAWREVRRRADVIRPLRERDR